MSKPKTSGLAALRGSLAEQTHQQAAKELKRGREVAKERERGEDGNIKFVCSNCGSSNVGTVGVIGWHADEQAWVMQVIYDDDTHAHCSDCDADNSKGSSIRLLPVEI